MAAVVLTNEYLLFNAVDLSAYLKSCTLTVEGDAVDTTTMGDSWKENTMGLKSGTLAIEFLDDFASGTVDATVWSAFNTGTAIAFEVRSAATTVTATNPKWTGSVLPNAHSVGGSLGDAAKKSLSFPTTGAITRATS